MNAHSGRDRYSAELNKLREQVGKGLSDEKIVDLANELLESDYTERVKETTNRAATKGVRPARVPRPAPIGSRRALNGWLNDGKLPSWEHLWAVVRVMSREARPPQTADRAAWRGIYDSAAAESVNSRNRTSKPQDAEPSSSDDAGTAPDEQSQGTENQTQPEAGTPPESPHTYITHFYAHAPSQVAIGNGTASQQLTTDTPQPNDGRPAEPPPGSNDPNQPRGRKFRRQTVLGGLLLALAILAVSTVWVVTSHGGKDTHAQAAAAPSTSQPPVTSTPLDSGDGCPLPTPGAKSPPASIAIIAWCETAVLGSDGFPLKDRWQFKLRPCITNNTAGDIDLGVTKTADRSSALRLLVDDPTMPASWKPSSLTRDAGDKPVQVSVDGHSYWAIPPNAPHDVTSVPALDDNGHWDGVTTAWDGYVTKWTDTKLTPENRSLYQPITYDDDGQPIQVTDLVFTISNPDISHATARGLAIVDPTNPSIVIAVSDRPDPARKQWAATF
ncbi:hypothetical protein [Nocardia nova]|uniref:hypothetical protein n=1 Tax=Nocardia nova TaxID=37330 RepID=UPI0033D64813